METLDRQIIDWIVSRSENAALKEQLRAARVIRRDYMRTGFFVYFELPDSTSPITNTARPLCPDISSPLLFDGAGTALFFRNGNVHYLEIYARGGFFPENIEDFKLLDPN
jgi:hypothetical protein